LHDGGLGARRLRDYLNALATDQARGAEGGGAVAAVYRDDRVHHRPAPGGLVDAAFQGAQHGAKDGPGTLVQNTCGGPLYRQAGGAPAPVPAAAS
jgi:hypothetical protein